MLVRSDETINISNEPFVSVRLRPHQITAKLLNRLKATQELDLSMTYEGFSEVAGGSGVSISVCVIRIDVQDCLWIA